MLEKNPKTLELEPGNHKDSALLIALHPPALLVKNYLFFNLLT